VRACECAEEKDGTMDPINISNLDLAEIHAADDDKVRWKGGFFSYGGAGSSGSATIYFVIAPGDRLGRHTDTTEETQFIASGSGELLLDEGSRPMKAGDVVVLPEGAPHDLVNTGSEKLEVIGFFSAPAVNQHWDDVVLPPNSHVTGSPNAPDL
jgi:quercetin dioxygenase-like cupin family protein